MDAVVRRALAEDIGDGDFTSLWTIPANARATATFLAKQSGVVAGLDVVRSVFAQVDATCTVAFSVGDGDTVASGQRFGSVAGPARALLSGERTALNFLQRMSGIATATRAYVDAVRGTAAVILDTRKTVPGLRLLDKYAVSAGGGQNHRIGLFDMVLIKDNHIRAAGGITAAVRAVQAANDRRLQVEVEVTNLEELREALALPVDRILLDNMARDVMREAVRVTAGRVPLEASGNVTLDTVRATAETGVNYISIGALTHSVRALDISMDFE
ncbi:MAG: carboxylating nicotinate-nucleotide diphosphorylase [Anaerolineae bacterium]